MIENDFLKKLPHTAGVYRMYDADHHVLYVGKAKDLQRRVRSYFTNQAKLSSRIQTMIKQVQHIEVTLTSTEEEALILEHNLIQALVPKYNIIFRDDKSYPYLTLSTGEVFPKLGYFRSNKSLQLLKIKKLSLFGPFPHAQAVYDTIQVLQRIFQIRTCEENVFAYRSRACLLHNIERCSAPCVQKITPEAYQQDVRAVVQFLEGKKMTILKQLEKKMYEASEKMAFEQAARYRDQLQSLQKIQQKQYINSQKPIYLDILAIATQTHIHQTVLCLNLVSIRDGKPIGERRFFYENHYHFDFQAILSAFFEQIYASLEETALPYHFLSNMTTEQQDAFHPLLATWRIHFVKKLNTEYQAWLKMAEENAQFALNRHLEKQPKQYQEALFLLNQHLGLPRRIEKIECFDVSHLQGNQTVGSCVVFQKKQMETSNYRHYQLDIASGNDLIGMQLLLTKHYTHQLVQQALLPDLILIDGGPLQLEAAKEVLSTLGLMPQIFLMAIAKGEGRKAGLETLFFLDPDHTEIHSFRLDHDDSVLHLLQSIRDEAHRFAIQYHRLKHRSSQLESILDNIPQVGKQRKKYLLEQFKTVDNLKNATIQDIAAVPKISENLAQQIHAFLQEN